MGSVMSAEMRRLGLRYMVNWCSLSFIHFCISQMLSVDSVLPGGGNVVVHTVSVVTL